VLKRTLDGKSFKSDDVITNLCGYNWFRKTIYTVSQKNTRAEIMIKSQVT